MSILAKIAEIENEVSLNWTAGELSGTVTFMLTASR